MVTDMIAGLRGWLFMRVSGMTKKNIQIGRGLRLYKKLEIQGPGRVIIGEGCTIRGAQGDPGQYVTLYTHSEGATITIGRNAALCAARMSAKFSISIGDDFFAEEAGIADTDFHSLDRDRGVPQTEDENKCAVMIGNRVSLGARSIVTKGVRLGDDVIIAPGSIVNKNIPDACYAMGNPAKVVQEFK